MARRRSTAVQMGTLAFLIATSAGCEWAQRSPAEGPSILAGGETLSERRWLGELSLQSSMKDAAGAVLGLPALLTAGPDGGFALTDRGDYTVKVFDGEARERWSFGRQGAGPREFSGFTSLMFQPDGGVAVLDPQLQRVTRIDRDGALVSTTILPERAIRLLPSHEPEQDWVLVPYDTARLWALVSAAGQRSGHRSRPPELRADHPLITEPHTSPSDMGAVMAFRWSSLLVFLDRDGGVRGIIDGIEKVAFPRLDRSMPGVTRVDRQATRAALDVSASHGRVLVLFRGATVADTGVVDVYDERAMSYVGSYRVPRTVVDIAALADERLATLETDSIPTIKIWSATTDLLSSRP